jgi:hypothetical protein
VIAPVTVIVLPDASFQAVKLRGEGTAPGAVMVPRFAVAPSTAVPEPVALTVHVTVVPESFKVAVVFIAPPPNPPTFPFIVTLMARHPGMGGGVLGHAVKIRKPNNPADSMSRFTGPSSRIGKHRDRPARYSECVMRETLPLVNRYCNARRT